MTRNPTEAKSDREDQHRSNFSHPYESLSFDALLLYNGLTVAQGAVRVLSSCSVHHHHHQLSAPPVDAQTAYTEHTKTAARAAEAEAGLQEVQLSNDTSAGKSVYPNRRKIDTTEVHPAISGSSETVTRREYTCASDFFVPIFGGNIITSE